MPRVLKYPSAEEGFTSVEESPLGQVIVILKETAKAMQEKVQKDKSCPKRNRTYSIKQLSAIEDYLEDAQNLLSYFENGKELGAGDVGFFIAGKGMLDKLANDNTFDEPAFTFYKVLNNHLKQSLKKVLDKEKIKRFTQDNLPAFRESLKTKLKEIKADAFEKARVFSSINTEIYFQVVDQVIDNTDFESFNKGRSIDSKKLNTDFDWFIYHAFFGFGQHQPQKLQITHQSVYEFVLEVLELIALLPQEFGEMVTFFNPAAITVNLQEGIASSFIPEVLQIKIEHSPDQSSKFRYSVSLGDGTNRIYNIEQLYGSKLGAIQNTLFTALADYFRDYAATPHVQSELAKTSLLRTFVAREQALDNKVYDSADRAGEFLTFQVDENALDAEDKARSLKKALDSLSDIERQIDDFQKRKAAYETENVVTLFSTHPELADYIQQDLTHNLDVSYSNQPLPDSVISLDRDGKVRAIPVKKALLYADYEIQSFQNLKPELENKIRELQPQLNAQIALLRERELMHHQQLNKNFSDDFEDMKETIASYNAVDDNNASGVSDLDERISLINDKLQVLESKQIEVEKMSNFVQDRLDQINQPKYSEILLAHDPSIIQEIRACYQGSKQSAEDSLHQLKEIQQNQNKAIALLTRQLDRAQAEKIFAATMKSSDPTPFVQLKVKRQVQNDEKIEALNQVRGKISEKEDLISDYKLILDKSSSNHNAELRQEQLRQGILDNLPNTQKTLVLLGCEQQVIEEIFNANHLADSSGINHAVQWLDNFLSTITSKRQKLLEKTENNNFYQTLKQTVTELSKGNIETPFRKSEQIQALLQPINELVEQLSEMQQLDSTMAFQQEARSTYSDRIAQLKEQKAQFVIELQTIEEELQNNQKEFPIIDRFIRFLENNSELNEAIQLVQDVVGELTTVEELNAIQDDFHHELDGLNGQIKTLDELAEGTSQLVDDLTNRDDYLKNMTNIQELVRGAKIAIDTILTPVCQKRLNNIDEKFTRIHQKLEGITEELATVESIAQLDLFNDILTRYQELPIDFEQCSQKFEHLQKDLSFLTFVNFEAKAEEVVTSLLNLSQSNSTLKIQLDAKTKDVLNHVSEMLQGYANRLGSIQMNESRQAHTNVTAALNGLEAELALFPSVQLQTLRNLYANVFPEEEEALEQLDAVLARPGQLDEQIQRKKAVNAALGNRIQEREALVQKYTTEMDDYLLKRKGRFKVKDSLFGTDAEKREQLVTDLKAALIDYEATGDSAPVYAPLIERKAEMHGFNFQSLLNRLWVETKELDEKRPANYDAVVIEQDDENFNAHETALGIVENCPEAFRHGVTDLFEKIASLHQFGQELQNNGYANDGVVAITLAQSLKNKLDYFLIDNQNNFNNPDNTAFLQQNYQAFQQDFACQVHSQDNVLNRHHSWIPFTVNLLLGLVSLGTLLAARLAYTKLSTGKASLFWQPEGLSLANEIEHTVDVTPISPAA